MTSVLTRACAALAVLAALGLPASASAQSAEDDLAAEARLHATIGRPGPRPVTPISQPDLVPPGVSDADVPAAVERALRQRRDEARAAMTAEAAGEATAPLDSPDALAPAAGTVTARAGTMSVRGSGRARTPLNLTVASGAALGGDGTLVFTGADDQTFASAASPQTVGSLEVAKTGGTLTVTVPLRVTGVFTPGTGALVTAGPTTLAATVASGEIVRLAALAGDGSALASPLVFERPHVDGEGWRMIAAPVAGPFTSLVDDFLTQGATNADYPFGAPNLFGYDPALVPASGYQAVPDYAAPFASGRGYLFYAFGAQPGVPTPLLPTTWDAQGLEPAGTVAVPLVYNASNAYGRFNLLGNPYAAPLDWHAMQTAGAFGTTYAVWDPGAAGGFGNYAYYSSSGTATGNAGRYIPAAQGFWAEATAASPASLTFSRDWKAPTAQPVYVGRGGAAAQLRFTLAGEGLVATEPVALFARGAENGPDAYDALWLTPLSSDYAAAYFTGAGGLPLVFDVRPETPAEPLRLAVDVTRAGLYTLAWPDLDRAPAGPVALLDGQTGRRIDLRAEPSYAFTVETPSPGRTAGAVPGQSEPVAPRFTVLFGEAATAADPPVPTVAALTLEAPRPNPARSHAAVRVGLPEAGVLRVTLLDLLGRTVAVVADGTVAAGWHDVVLPADDLPAGVYVVRLDAGGQTRTTRLVVAR